MKIGEVMRSLAAIEREVQENTRLPPGVKAPCRNRHTGQRGITYMKGTGRYRAFAHRPFYKAIGTYPSLELAVMARDRIEAAGMRRVYDVAPELADDDNQDAVQFKRHSCDRYAVAYVVNGVVMSAECQSFDDCLEWLRVTRGIIRGDLRRSAVVV